MVAAIISAILLLGSTIFFGYKYFTIKKLFKDFQQIGTGRYGFYKVITGLYGAYIYVDELDRYTNGFSNIKIHRIEAVSTSYPSDSIDWAKNKFVSLKLTSEIDWLEGEDHIKKLRKEKLDKLSKI